MMRQNLERLLHATSADDLWQVFAEVMWGLGYPHVCYTARRFADMPRMWLAEDLEWRSTYPDSFLADMRHEDLLTASPWSAWSRENTGARPASWIETDAGAAYLTTQSRQMIATCQRHGVWHGHVVSLLGVSVRVTGTVVMNTGRRTDQAHADDLWEKVGNDVISLAQVMHLRINALPRIQGEGVLTRRQREVVEWAAYGKTVAEIARILGVTSTTIEKHLRLAREQLGVGTTAQAILKAHVKNQIFIGDPQVASSR